MVALELQADAAVIRYRLKLACLIVRFRSRRDVPNCPRSPSERDFRPTHACRSNTQYQNDPDIYRPELRSTNRGHRHESDW